MSAIDTIAAKPSHVEHGRAENLFLALLSAVLFRLQAMAEKSRSRRALSALGDDQLKDIGLSRSDAYREASRPFWD